MTTDLRALVAELREARTDFDGSLLPDYAEPIGVDCGLLRRAEAALDAQAGMVCVGWEVRIAYKPRGQRASWIRANEGPHQTPSFSPEFEYRRIYAGPVEGGKNE